MKYSILVILALNGFFTVSAQDMGSTKDSNAAASKVFIYKNDTFHFKKPDLLRNIGRVPSDIWQITKSPFQKRYLVDLGTVAASTALLITYDADILKWVRKKSDQVGLSPQTDYHIAWKMGHTKILKIPQNLNTVLYQLGEGGTSMILAGGLWIYGKIEKDIRAVNTANDIAETFVAMGVTTQVLKRITGRESPFMRTKEGGQWKPFPSFAEFQRNTSAYDAFPSGHLATLMATITVLTADYPEKKWIKPVGYTLMCLSGWAMVNTEVHWVGDYPLAIAIGYLSGKITTRRHRTNNAIRARPVVL